MDRETERTGSPVLAVEDLQYTYPGGEEPAVRGVSFEIARGEILGFLGPSGAGKSTTQNVLTGLLEGYEGRVVVFGEEIGEWDDDYYERVGVSAESPNQYLKLTGRENLELFASLYDGETADPGELLDRVGLAAAADRDVRELVRERKRAGTTVFLTTHDMAVADDLCDRVAFIIDGQLAAVDDPASLKRTHGDPRVRVDYRQNGAVESAEFDLPTVGSDGVFASCSRPGTSRASIQSTRPWKTSSSRSPGGNWRDTVRTDDRGQRARRG